MSLIDETYFVFEVDLPASNYSDLSGFIARLEPEVLIKALGYELAKQVIAYNSQTTTAPIKSLVEGGEFVNSEGNMQKWNGFINTIKKSIIAYYVYYYYRRAKVTYTTRMGEKKGKGENSVDAEIGMKVMRAWNLMLKELETMDEYIKTIPALSDIYKPSRFGTVNAFDL
jgi:hypothetical protein